MKKIESGRSMIEMLGVLAIIGVLSIGGLAAYNMAMDRHAANGVLDYAAKASLRATEMNAAGQALVLPAGDAEDNTFYGITQPDEVTAVGINGTSYTLTVAEDIFPIVDDKDIENIEWIQAQ